MITIRFDEIKASIKRHLSVIGKRTYSNDGKNMFSDITVSSIEDPIFNQYINAGAQNVDALLRPLLESLQITSDNRILLSLVNTRGVDGFEASCSEFIITYITLFSVGEYLAMTHPELAEKYRLDAANAIQALQMYAFYKTPPAKTGYSYNDITGKIA